jgi:hypothetical protein
MKQISGSVVVSGVLSVINCTAVEQAPNCTFTCDGIMCEGLTSLSIGGQMTTRVLQLPRVAVTVTSSGSLSFVGSNASSLNCASCTVGGTVTSKSALVLAAPALHVAQSGRIKGESSLDLHILNQLNTESLSLIECKQLRISGSNSTLDLSLSGNLDTVSCNVVCRSLDIGASSVLKFRGSTQLKFTSLLLEGSILSLSASPLTFRGEKLTLSGSAWIYGFGYESEQEEKPTVSLQTAVQEVFSEQLGFETLKGLKDQLGRFRKQPKSQVDPEVIPDTLDIQVKEVYLLDDSKIESFTRVKIEGNWLEVGPEVSLTCSRFQSRVRKIRNRGVIESLLPYIDRNEKGMSINKCHLLINTGSLLANKTAVEINCFILLVNTGTISSVRCKIVSPLFTTIGFSYIHVSNLEIKALFAVLFSGMILSFERDDSSGIWLETPANISLPTLPDTEQVCPFWLFRCSFLNSSPIAVRSGYQ